MRILVFVLFINSSLFAQKNMFDTLIIDSSTKIIGRFPEYDKSKSYEEYNFIIQDSTKIVEFIRNLRLGKEVKNLILEPSFILTIVKNYEEIGRWTIYPSLKKIITHDGHNFAFDLNQISSLNKQYPFKYYTESKIFNSRVEFENYIAKQRENPFFLFNYEPQFKYEGSFEIEFPKSSKFPNPKAISEFLTTEIEEIVNKDEYDVYYMLNDKNLNNRNQFTMTIQGPKMLFDNLQLGRLKNENWTPTIETALFFYKE